MKLLLKFAKFPLQPRSLNYYADMLCYYRWTCASWPHKIGTLLDTIAEHLEEDEERFHKNLLTEQNNFQERLDGLNMVVAGFSGHTDILK